MWDATPEITRAVTGGKKEKDDIHEKIIRKSVHANLGADKPQPMKEAIHEGHEEERVATEFAENTENTDYPFRVLPYYYPAISCFLRTFFQARTQREGEAPAEPLENRSNPLRLGRSLALPERPRFTIWLRFPALCLPWTKFFLWSEKSVQKTRNGWIVV